MTILTNEQREAMFKAAQPLIEWMDKNLVNRHSRAIVDCNSVELLEGVATCLLWLQDRDDGIATDPSPEQDNVGGA